MLGSDFTLAQKTNSSLFLFVTDLFVTDLEWRGAIPMPDPVLNEANHPRGAALDRKPWLSFLLCY
jgi:hypothetical protein